LGTVATHYISALPWRLIPQGAVSFQEYFSIKSDTDNIL